MKNFSEQEVRSDMLANYGCSVPVYFKILKCRKDFDRFPYFYISGKEYILWIYANPRHPEDTTKMSFRRIIPVSNAFSAETRPITALFEILAAV